MKKADNFIKFITIKVSGWTILLLKWSTAVEQANANSFCAITRELFNKCLINFQILLQMTKWRSNLKMTIFTSTVQEFWSMIHLKWIKRRLCAMNHSIFNRCFQISTFCYWWLNGGQVLYWRFHFYRSEVMILDRFENGTLCHSVQFLMNHSIDAFQILTWWSRWNPILYWQVHICHSGGGSIRRFYIITSTNELLNRWFSNEAPHVGVQVIIFSQLFCQKIIALLNH